MLIKNLDSCKEIIANDGSILREIFSPLKDNVNIRYSLALAKVKAKEITKRHRLKSTEVYFILQGKGIMYIDNEAAEVKKGDIIYIPPNSIQRIENIGEKDLIFLCIVDPAWKEENEEILNDYYSK